MTQTRLEDAVSKIDLSDPDVLEIKPYKMRPCTIMATITDTQITPVDIQKMMESGMNVARFKMPNYSKNDRIRLLGKVDMAATRCCQKYGVNNWPVASCIELRTCVMKTGLLDMDEPFIILKEKTEVILTSNVSDYNKCSDKKIFIENPSLTHDVSVGKEITIASGEIVLMCTEMIDEKSVKCIAKKGGRLHNVCNVSIRGVTHSRPVITKRDLQLIKFALEYQVDIIAINYVRNADALIKVKEYIGKKARRPMILSGICTEQALDNIDEIIKESDGIILSREFLPYELEESKKYRLNTIQKWVAAKCQQAGKPLYLSGGVLQHLLTDNEYKECEIVDICNAVMDGVTGFILRDCDFIEMLLDAIRILDEVSREMEPFTRNHPFFWTLTEKAIVPLNAAEAAILSCAALAIQTNARVIICPTVTGRTAKALMAMRPAALILAICSSVQVARMLFLYRCMVPLLYSGQPRSRWHQTVDDRIDFALQFAVRRGWLHYGDVYVTLQRGSEDVSYCDMIRFWTVTISKKPLVECSDDEGEKVVLT